MFYGCHSLKYLNISNFNFSKVLKMSFMFYDCSSLNNLDIPNLIINEKADIDSMFSKCKQELKEAIRKKKSTSKRRSISKLYIIF